MKSVAAKARVKPGATVVVINPVEALPAGATLWVMFARDPSPRGSI
jgi:hypothetical protein